MEDKQTCIEIHTELGMHTDFELKSLVPLSGTLLRCACLCADRCKKIEKEFIDGKTTQDKNDLHQEDMANACGAVVLSVAFLEATINEFFQRFFYDFDKLNIDKSQLVDLKSEWESGEKNKILFSNLEDKYVEYAYERILNKKLDKNTKLWDNFKKLILLRNSLVHFKAKWQNELSGKDKEYEIEDLGKRFKKNPFMEGSGNRHFPKRLLNAECAVWSINVSTKFRTVFAKDLSDSNIDISLRPDITKILNQYSLET